MVAPVQIPVTITTAEGSVHSIATVDSGALLNCVSTRLVDGHAEVFTEVTPSTIVARTADVSIHTPRGSLRVGVRVDHAHDTVIAHSTFQIMTTTDDWDILLGRPWLKQTRAVVDHGSDTLLLPSLNEVIRISAKPPTTVLPLRFVDMTAFSEDASHDVCKDITFGSDLSDAQLSRIRRLVMEKSAAFATSLSQLEECPHTEHILTVADNAKLHKTAFG
jgi:hypothetical protein